MGTEVAVKRGVGTVVLDVRRGDGPKPGFHFTFASIAATGKLVTERPEVAAAAARAMAATHAALKADISLATGVGRKLFPAAEAELIAELIRRDLPYYQTRITREAIDGMNAFAGDLGLIERPVAFEQIVAAQLAPSWQ
jgi:NitT/TauT family transport system substrate-binding protein